MTFEECVQTIQEGSVVDFKEYTLDRHEKKHLSLEISGAVVQKVFPANETLSRDVLEEYYGTELGDTDYLQLATMNCPRFVLTLGENPHGTLDIKIIILNKDFYTTGLQTVEVTNQVDVNTILNEPNYVLAQKGW